MSPETTEKTLRLKCFQNNGEVKTFNLIKSINTNPLCPAQIFELVLLPQASAVI